MSLCPFVHLLNSYRETPESRYLALINHIGLPGDDFPNSSLSLVEGICDHVEPVKLAEVAGAVSTLAFIEEQDNITARYHAMWYITLMMATHLGAEAAGLLAYYMGEYTAKHVARKGLPDILFDKFGHVLPVLKGDSRMTYLAGVCEGLGDARLGRALGMDL